MKCMLVFGFTLLSVLVCCNGRFNKLWLDAFCSSTVQKTLVCNTHSKMVCGSDGKLYDSTCEFSRALCKHHKEGKTLTALTIDKCKVTKPSKVTEPTSTATNENTSATVTGKATTEIPKQTPRPAVCNDAINRCPQTKAPVCGDNGKTYTHECALCLHMKSLAEKGDAKTIKIVSDGSCDGVVG